MKNTYVHSPVELSSNEVRLLELRIDFEATAMRLANAKFDRAADALDGTVYDYNASTRQSTWTRPTAVTTPPKPPRASALSQVAQVAGGEGPPSLTTVAACRRVISCGTANMSE